MRFLTSLVLFAASALAVQVTFPRDDDKWASQASNTLTWEVVSTDPDNFQVVLVNADFSVNQVLMASVPKNSGTISIPPPSSGFPVGDDFRINLMSLKDGNTQPGILAQSGTFTIVAGSSVATGSTTGTGALPTTMSRSTNAAAAATAARSASLDISTTASGDDVLNPTGTPSGNSAANSFSGVALTGALFGTMSALVALLF